MPGELVVRKTTPFAFFEPSMTPTLTLQVVQTRLVSYAVTIGCVRFSVVDAMSFGSRPIVVSDCVGDRAQGPHASSMFDMEQKYAALLLRDNALRLRA